MDFSDISEVFESPQNNLYKLITTHLHTIIYLLAGTSALGLIAKFGLDYIWKHYFASLTIPSSDSRYNWVILWLNNHGPLNDCQHISIALRVRFGLILLTLFDPIFLAESNFKNLNAEVYLFLFQGAQKPG